MKTIDVALKDLRQGLANAFFIVFGLVLPMATAGLFFFAFGGTGGQDDSFDLAAVPVIVANQDQGQAGFAVGDMVADVLHQVPPNLLQVTDAAGAAEARAAVDEQRAAVAVIIPENMTAAVMAPRGQARVELYQDPTLSLGPGIVKAIVGQVIDGFAGSKIAMVVAAGQLASRGAAPDTATLQGIVMEYATWATQLGQAQSGGGSPFVEIRAPAGAEEKSNEGTRAMLGQIMAGMMVFYVFFTGAASAQTILQEDEGGTLPRLFSTPTPQTAILGGKFLAAFALLVVQVTVLVVASWLIFGIDWGPPLEVALVVAGLVVVAASFGILVTSLLKNTRQGGIVYGGVLTVMGMVGMVGVFAAGVPGTSNPMATASLVVPQGWAVRGWQQLVLGAGPDELAVTVAVMLAEGALFFVLGALRFRKRFA